MNLEDIGFKLYMVVMGVICILFMVFIGVGVYDFINTYEPPDDAEPTPVCDCQCRTPRVIEMDDGQVPGDDIPAETSAAMTEEEIEAVEEDYENEKIEQALLARSTKLENVLVTYYCAEQRPHICGTGDGITASGRRVTPDMSVAVDRSLIPLGATIIVDYGDGELHYYRADDTGGAIKGKHIDICVPRHQEALELGTRHATVYWCMDGDA